MMQGASLLLDHEDDKVSGLLQDLVPDSHDVEQFLTRLVTTAGRTLSSEDDEVLCGVMVLRERSKTTVASNGPAAQKMGEIQYQFNDGPCLRAALAVRIAGLTDSSAHMRAAMESRTTIDLAAGVIMGQSRCSQDAAMEILKGASSSRNIRLRAVAASVLESLGQGPVRTHFE